MNIMISSLGEPVKKKKKKTTAFKKRRSKKSETPPSKNIKIEAVESSEEEEFSQVNF